MGKKRIMEFGIAKEIQSSWVPVTPVKLVEARPQPDCDGKKYKILQGLHAQTSLLNGHEYDAAPFSAGLSQDLEENKQDISICTPNLHQGEPTSATLGSDSPAISTTSKKRNDKKRDSTNIVLNERSGKKRRKKKHRPKVVVEGMTKRTPRTKTAKTATPRRATSKRETSTKRKYTRKNKLRETETVCEKAKKTCKRALNFETENYSIAEIRNDTVQESLCTSHNNEVESPSTREPKRSELIIENIAGGACGLAHSENGISPDHSFSLGLEFLKRSSSSLRVYRRLFQCLTHSRKIGPNFPKICKKRRFNKRQKATTFSPWWSVATDEHGQYCYTLRNRKISAKISSQIKSKVRDSIIGESLTCMVSLCNSMVKTKKKMRSNQVIHRKNSACFTAIPKYSQSPRTTFKPAPIVSTESLQTPVKQAPIMNTESSSLPSPFKTAPIVSTEPLPPPVKPALIVKIKSPPPPINEIPTGDRQRFHAPETSVDVLQTGKCEKKVETRQTEIGLSLVNVRSCYSRSEVSSLANQKISSQRHGVGIVPGINFHKHAMVPINHKKRISKKYSKMRPSEGCSPPEREDIFLTANLRDPLELSKVMDFLLQRLESLHISNEDSGKGTIVPYEGPFDPKKKRRVSAKVNLDTETMRVWNLLMEKDGRENVDNIADEEKQKWWEDERKVFRGRVDSFIARMHLIQGDRRFSAWKGSVVDSVVGVFLTQNVSDHLSSSAFMSLAANFPVESTSSHKPCYEDRKLSSNQELIDLNMVVEEQVASSKTEVCMNHETDNIAEMVNKASRMLACDEDSNADERGLTEKAKDRHDQLCFSGMDVNREKPSSTTRKKGATEEKKETTVDWDKLRKSYSGGQGQRSSDTMDSVNWEAVKRAKLDEVANTIRQRGQHFVIAERIQDFLNRVVAHHETIDLEWLRNVPPDDAKELLLSIRGLGLKSVECVRLLALQHIAFPVDTNVGRIAVRLGWVPLQPLPEEVQIHLLDDYPLMDTIQKYLWPRLCKLDQRTLYELHYQMITFGKVFCTKRQPNCNPCPMRGECRHFASAFASAKLALPGPKEKSVVTSIVPVEVVRNTDVNVTTSTISFLKANSYSESGYQTSNCEPIIEEPTSPESEYANMPERDIEDFYNDESDEIPTIKLNLESFTTNLLGYIDKYRLPLPEGDLTKSLVALNYEAASIPRPKLKSVGRLRTQHQVYELPDSHPLLIKLDKREPDDPCPYLLSIWMPGETANSLKPPKKRCNSQESGNICNEQTCFPCNFIREQNSHTIRGTILIPCRTAMRGRFPLNGTYFQVNEVFSDHESSLHPINVPTSWLWNLPRRTVYCGTSATSIFRDLSTQEIQHCFWRGYICVRGFDRKTRAPRPLDKRLHASGTWKAKTERDDR